MTLGSYGRAFLLCGITKSSNRSCKMKDPFFCCGVAKTRPPGPLPRVRIRASAFSLGLLVSLFV